MAPKHLTVHCVNGSPSPMATSGDDDDGDERLSCKLSQLARSTAMPHIVRLKAVEREVRAHTGGQVGNRAVTVSVDALLPADSPRQSGVDEQHVETLAQLPEELPPIMVHRETMRVIDGMHRLRAAVRQGRDTVRVEFFDGTEQDAFVAAVQANNAHGLPLTLAERRIAATRLLHEHPDWSDRAVARIAGLAHKTVSAVRRSSGEQPQLNARLGSDGRLRPADAAERRAKARQLIIDRPDASLREIARVVGLSPTTVLAVRDGVAGELENPPGARPPNNDARPQRADRLHTLWQALLQDPEIRFNETGRVLLRMLQVQAVTDPQTWDRLAVAVPSRHVGTVADLASQCARMWEDFADEVRRREQRS
jgi:ParB-like chromosome segregation protein Spo0J